MSITGRLFEIDDNDSGIEQLFKDDDDSRMLGRRLVMAYNSLTYNQRVSVYLRYVRGLSYKEIAAVMEMNPQSAMNLVSRALKSLRAEMGSNSVPDLFMHVIVISKIL